LPWLDLEGKGPQERDDWTRDKGRERKGKGRGGEEEEGRKV